MRVCDYCKEEIPDDKIITLHFNSFWFKIVRTVKKEFCSLLCLKKWLEER